MFLITKKAEDTITNFIKVYICKFLLLEDYIRNLWKINNKNSKEGVIAK